MLQVPKSIVDRWSPFETHWLDARAVLELCLDNEPCVEGCRLPFDELAALGWRSDPARRLLDQACERMAQRCADRHRYGHNVSVRQEFDGWDDKHLALATAADGRLRRPPRRLTAKASHDEDISQRVKIRDRYSKVPSWAMLAPKLRDGDLALVAAPLCLQSREGGGTTASLCDYPGISRRPSDPHVPLIGPPEEFEILRTTLGSAGAWHPFARCLGRVQDRPSGRALRLLRLELRIPLTEARPYTHRPTWDEALVEEAATGDGLRETKWAADVLAGLSQATPFAARVAIDKVVDPQHREKLLHQLCLATESTHRSLMRDAGSPFEGPDAFWCALVALLTGWPESFALSDRQREVLVIAFDASHDQAWKDVAGDPALAIVVRYSPMVMAAVRAQLAASSRH